MKTIVSVVSLLTFLVIACSASVQDPQRVQAALEQDSSSEVVDAPDLATVTHIEFQPYSDKSDAIAVYASGPLPNLCTKLGALTREREGNTIFVTLEVEHDPKAFCGDGSPGEFTQVIPITGLEPGTYTVSVNGLQAEFTLGGE